MIEATPRTQPDDIYLTAPEVADMMRKSVATLANERNRGEGLPYVKCGGKILYRSGDVLQAINERTCGFTWRKLQASLERYGLQPGDVEKMLEHLKRDM